MARFASNKTLARVGRAKIDQIASWKEGAYLESSTGRTIDVLRKRAAADRWRLANQFRISARVLLVGKPPRYRDAISRYYYAMYHAVRAAAYVHHGGDDFEAHSELSQRMPTDFPNAGLWKNKLKDARARRNEADYDPYPKTPAAWKTEAANLAPDAATLLATTQTYLRGKGCPL